MGVFPRGMTSQDALLVIHKEKDRKSPDPAATSAETEQSTGRTGRKKRAKGRPPSNWHETHTGHSFGFGVQVNLQSARRTANMRSCA